MGNFEEPRNIYHEIGSLLWSVFPDCALEVYLDCQVFDTFTERTFYWLDEDGNESWHDFGDNPTEILRLAVKQLEKLQRHPLFEKERWTHCRVSLSIEKELNIKFAYVEKKDTWPGVFMKGIGELTEQEAKQASVPEALWLEAIAGKKS
ncbi:conserved hypothetical protein [Vibrio owensii]|uniref:hypothetical protein n=1 Tax=Vibrio owensii TaxID=696485 RepID=UPI0028944087|nr:conserved hypothetical protein [Vibrio owensii]CAH1589717.1 conserved hypothetical protein [Vibrio owensii]